MNAGKNLKTTEQVQCHHIWNLNCAKYLFQVQNKSMLYKALLKSMNKMQNGRWGRGGACALHYNFRHRGWKAIYINQTSGSKKIQSHKQGLGETVTVKQKCWKQTSALVTNIQGLSPVYNLIKATNFMFLIYTVQTKSAQKWKYKTEKHSRKLCWTVHFKILVMMYISGKQSFLNFMNRFGMTQSGNNWKPSIEYYKPRDI